MFLSTSRPCSRVAPLASTFHCKGRVAANRRAWFQRPKVGVHSSITGGGDGCERLRRVHYPQSFEDLNDEEVVAFAREVTPSLWSTSFTSTKTSYGPKPVRIF